VLFDKASLAGKRVLITGGGTGLGKGIAKHLAEHGSEVHLWGRRREILNAAAEEINAARGRVAHVQPVDVRQFDQVDAAVAEIWEKFGPLTGLINNAAANFIAPYEGPEPTRLRGYSLHRDGWRLFHDAGLRPSLDQGWEEGIYRFYAGDLGVDGLPLRSSVGNVEGGHRRHDEVARRRVGTVRHPSERGSHPGRFRPNTRGRC